MNALRGLGARIAPLAERFDALAVRERGLLFAAALTIVYFSWQYLLMDPLLARGQRALQRLDEARHHLTAIGEAGAAVGDDPLLLAASRNRALKGRLETLNGEMQAAAQGYVAPERMAGLLREMLAGQQGLTLVSLTNLPVASLSQAPASAADAPTDADDRGPFLHPVEMVVEGSYSDIVGYLRTLEGLSWRVYWQRLELDAGVYPRNRVRIVIGALSLSRDWISV
jgi:MSHA biogenesis protein MshJ